MAIQWAAVQQLQPLKFTCGHCGNVVGPNIGFVAKDDQTNHVVGLIYICSFCSMPTYAYEGRQIPGVAYGAAVGHLSPDLERLYNEARQSSAVASYTSAVLTCRKILMNVAVEQGAKEGKSFIEYVEYLASNGYVPPHGKGWVDHIRKKGNEANHEIKLMSQDDAQELISFVEMLLKFIYEFPARVPAPAAPAAPATP